MFPRSKVEGKPVADPARAVCRGPIQLSGFAPRRRPPSRWPALLLVVWLLSILLAGVSLTAGGPTCDRWSALPWLECRR